MMGQQENPSRSIPGGPSCGANEVLGNNMYHDVFPSSDVVGYCPAVARTSQPFANFHHSYTTSAFKSPGGMAGNVGFPFTYAQRKELERQAMIYKCMIASIPVPFDLLFPMSRNFPAAPDPSSAAASLGGGGPISGLRYSRNGDPEPGRCRRTDGKKWRCAKDAVPNHKYCERHLNRSRPRSRKPVEVKGDASLDSECKKKICREQSPCPAPAVPHSVIQDISTSSHQFVNVNEAPWLFNAKTSLGTSGSRYDESHRNLSLMKEGEMVSTDAVGQQWQQLMDKDIALTNEESIFKINANLSHQDYPEYQPFNLSYTNFSVPEDVVRQVDECNTGLYFSPNLVALEEHTEIETPRNFIDAWSNESFNNIGCDAGSSVASDNGNLSPASLTLSMAMAAGDVLDEQMKDVQMGGGVGGSDENRPKVSSWLPPVSWLPFAQGGPLAEALNHGAAAAGSSHPASPHDSINTPATTVSSPSGVLHRTLFSSSDSSVCNSPTLAAPTAEAVAFPWLSKSS